MRIPQGTSQEWQVYGLFFPQRCWTIVAVGILLMFSWVCVSPASNFLNKKYFWDKCHLLKDRGIHTECLATIEIHKQTRNLTTFFFFSDNGACQVTAFWYVSTNYSKTMKAFECIHTHTDTLALSLTHAHTQVYVLYRPEHFWTSRKYLQRTGSGQVGVTLDLYINRLTVP